MSLKTLAARLNAQMRARYPHVCPRCGDPAYIGLRLVECASDCTRAGAKP